MIHQLHMQKSWQLGITTSLGLPDKPQLPEIAKVWVLLGYLW
jgi:hypothetical protein